ncbi:efflux RND transporter periplasmic adaptor subunit [Acerihabitans sp. TG2]|uniref:efflux RND transporter periplasmic adaptor subunit n=1 Tax=Acerihabitans sp. TG2 TaxID=3096008 RepID=UPI002B227D7A|nr:efflux RND transporter periplasmic adaptor subunit [Acerihabitans sp. TG2]MEA9390124.1 efflux RND transporter periplasmic adaptor subunit [Acerihabitans sp. TG2]
MTDIFNHCAKAALHHLWCSGRLKPLFPGLIALVLLVFAVLLLSSCGDKKPKQNVPPRPVRVIVVPAPTAGIAFTQTGEIRAHDDVTLGFRVDGRLLTRTVDVGDHVQAGQLIATVENDTSQNQLRSARADLDSAQAAERVAALNLQRMKLLMPQGAIARSQYDTAQSDWQAAQSHRRSNEAALKNAQDNLSWTHLTAQQSGVIISVSAAPGQVLSAGQTVVTLAVGSGRDAVFNLADPQVITRNTGVPFTLSLLADPSVHTTGHLRDISPQADPQTRTWRVRVALDALPDAMALGASVLGEIEQTGMRAMVLPASALTRLGTSPAVFVVNRASRQLQLRPVKLAHFTATEIFIASGINPGEMVVTAGVSKLRQGEKVSLDEDKP